MNEELLKKILDKNVVPKNGQTFISAYTIDAEHILYKRIDPEYSLHNTKTNNRYYNTFKNIEDLKKLFKQIENPIDFRKQCQIEKKT